ncbi:aluminum activated malate transporter family protein [Halomicrobium urmianum]|uniref:aluminum activated malate transporter family protein n=1 Tax=Halomicrobium urmianum TaxID=1586233 RepID=UPI001CD9F698|nr:aluminum activated malate transporter family protein [Halomicrobium urmianum]
MDFEFDSGKLLYAIGVALAIASLVYFMRDLVFGLSITVKAALLFLAFVAFFAVGVATERDVLDAVAFALSGGAYLVGLGYVVSNYPIEDTGTFLLLAVSAALFVGLGYLLRERGFALPVRTAASVVAVLAVVGVALVGADAVGGGVTYDLETNESVTVEPPTGEYPDNHVPGVEKRVGTLTATNEFVFRRALDPPQVVACVVDGDGVVQRHAGVSLSTPGERYGYPQSIGGGGTVPMHLTLHLDRDRNQTAPVTYAVERAGECPTDVDEPTVAIVVDPDERGGTYGRPV